MSGYTPHFFRGQYGELPRWSEINLETQSTNRGNLSSNFPSKSDVQRNVAPPCDTYYRLTARSILVQNGLR